MTRRKAFAHHKSGPIQHNTKTASITGSVIRESREVCLTEAQETQVDDAELLNRNDESVHYPGIKMHLRQLQTGFVSTCSLAGQLRFLH